MTNSWMSFIIVFLIDNVGVWNTKTEVGGRMAKNLKWFLGALDQYGVRLVFGQVARFYYGNDAGLFNNYFASKNLSVLQKQSPSTPASDLATAKFKNQGFLRVKNNYDPAFLKNVKQRYDQLIADDQYSLYIGPRIHEALRAIKEPLKMIPELSTLLTDTVKQQVQAYYGTNFKVLHVRCWRTYHVSEEQAKQDVYSNLWHNDPFPITLLRYFVYLSDGVNQNTGALHMHSINNTKKIMRNGYLRRRAIVGPAAKLISDPTKTIIFDGDLGDGCLMNPQLCLHRAGIPQFGKSRDMIQFTFAPSKEALSERWFQELPADPEGIRA